LDNQVDVPEAFFKLAYCPDKEPRAWIFPNSAGQNHKTDEYRRPIEDVESLTGLSFKHTKGIPK